MTDKTQPKGDRPSRDVTAMVALIKGRTDLEIAELGTGIPEGAAPALRMVSGDLTRTVALIVAAVRHSRG